MKFSTSTSLLAAAVAAFSSTMVSAQSTLEEKWWISDEPDFTYSSLDFTLAFPITDFIVQGQAQYSLYTEGCKEDGIPLSDGDGIIDNGIIDTTNTVRNKGTVNQNQKATVQVSVDDTTIADNSLLYSENDQIGDVSAQIVFCVRFGLFTGGNSTTEVEVNFLETVITLDVDLSDGFEIASIAVAPKDKLIRTAAQAYQVEGYICKNDETPVDDLAAVRNQGAQIRVCVRPDRDARDDGIYMRAIDNFEWKRESPVEITQQAVVNRQESDNTLTSLYCAPGELVCHFVSILFASFYATPGAVTGSGVASMQFGGDNVEVDGDDYVQKDKTTGLALTSWTKPTPANRNLRALQEQDEDTAAASEFDLSFDVDQGDLTFSDSTSGASSTVGTLAMSMLAAAGALAMF